jgi:hypothetical protein
MLYVKHNTETDALDWYPNGELEYDFKSDEECALDNIYRAKNDVFPPYGKIIDGYAFVWNEDRTAVLFDPVFADVDLTEIRDEKKAALAAIRWSKETQGTVINGIPVHTDDRSRSTYLGMLMALQFNPSYEVSNFKAADSNFYTFGGQEITAIAFGVRDYVQSCFDREQELKAEIDAATTAQEIADLDIENGW